MFQTPPLIGVQNTLVGSTASAILWIIAPRLYSAQAKRPMIYNFGAEFVGRAEDAVSRMAENNGRLKVDILTSSPALMCQTMTPSSEPSHVLDMRHLSTMWTFMLVVNNDKVGPGGIVRAMSDCQHLYYGMFLEEPFNPNNHMGRQTFNPNAVLLITHKTLINKNTTIGAYGNDQRVDIMADFDVVHPTMINTISMNDTGMALLRPEDLYQSTTDDRDMTVMYNSSSLLEHQGDPLPINSTFSVPRHNVYKVLSGVADARGMMEAETAAGRVLHFNQDSYRTLVDENIRDTVRQHDITGLRTNTPITLGSLISRYNPKCEIVQQDAMPHYNPIDQSVISGRNIFATMLTSVVPAMMSEFALADISFRYDSYNNVFELNEGSSPASLTPMSQADLMQRVRGFIFRMTHEILPIPKLNHGDYVLFMSCTCCGVTHINLNFLDSTIKTADVFEVPTVLGGFNSSMIGNSTVFHNNARELTTLINSLVNNDTDRAPLGQFDHASLERSLKSYDQTLIQPFGSSSQPSDPLPTQYRC